MTSVSQETDAIRQVLESTPYISDYRLISRSSQTGSQLVLAYVVPASLYSQEKLESELYSVPCLSSSNVFLIPLSAVPRNKQGDWDEACLTTIPAIGEKLFETLEEKAIREPGIRSAVVIQELVEQPARLHLSDVLPDYEQRQQQDAERPDFQVPSLSENSSPASDVSPRNPALSEGRNLIIPEGAPAVLPQMLSRAADIGSRDALIFHHAENSTSSVSYAELRDQAIELLRGFSGAGLKPGSPVIFQIADNREFLQAFWACVLGGMIPVPMSLITDSGSKELERFEGIWKSLECAPVLSSGSQTEVLVNLLKPLQSAGLKIIDLHGLGSDETGKVELHQVEPDDIALIMLTSGSTGVPKGVPLTHRNLISRSIASVQLHGFDRSMVTLNWMPLDHVAGLIYFHLRDLYLGCKQIHVQADVVLGNPTFWLDLLETHQVNVTFAPNFAFGLVCKDEELILRSHWDLSSVQLILNGGESIVAATARKFLILMSRHGLSADVMCPAWGMSEVSSGITYATDFSLDTTSDEDAYVEVGFPIPGDSLRIVDDDDCLLREGEIGRLQVRGATVFSGYFGVEDSGSEVFTKDGWFITGDLGLLKNGSLTITGREKDIIIINGVNYSGPRIESSVEKIDGVVASFTAAVALPDVDGDGSECLGIFFSAINDDDRSLKVLAKKIRDQVVRDEGIAPSYLVPLPMSEIHKTSIGKIQRPQLSKRFVSGDFQSITKKMDLLMGNSNTLPAWFLLPDWQAKSLSATTKQGISADSCVVVVTSPGDHVCSAVLQKMEDLGIGSIRVEHAERFEVISEDHYKLNSESEQDYRLLFSSLRGARKIPTHFIYDYQSDDFRSQTGSSDCSLLACTRFVTASKVLIEESHPEDTPVKAIVINRYWSGNGNRRYGDFVQAPVTGLVKSIVQEQTTIKCASLDIGGSDIMSAADHIVNELTGNLPDPEVAIRSGQRIVPGLRPVTFEPDRATGRLRKRGWYLVSGGLGGVGLVLIAHFLRQFQANIIITGRGPVTAGSVRGESFEELSSLPGSVHYIDSDLGSVDSLRRAILELSGSESLELNGIFHLAGNYHELPVIEESAESLDDMLMVKMRGALTLLALIEGNSDAFFVGFSSVSSLFGGATVGGYSAANTFLDRLALQGESSNQIYSINWATWRDTGISQSFKLKEPLLASGYMEMSVEQALQSLDVILSQPPGQYVVGLDINNVNIRSRLTKVYPMSVLTCVCELEQGRDLAPLRKINAEDEFGVKCSANVVVIPHLPVRDDGSIDRQAVKSMFAPESSQIVRPSTSTETKLAAIWQKILGLDEISINWSFFELGGQSLLANQLNSEIVKEFQVEWSLRTIFEFPTIKEQASRIDQSGKEVDPIVEVMRASDTGTEKLPLSSAQKRMWFMDQFSPTHHMYNISAALTIAGDVEVNYLIDSVQVVVDRHEALRTIFIAQEGQPVQVIKDSITIPVPVMDLSQMSANERKSRLQEIEKKEAAKAFDLEQGPLIRVNLLCTAPQECVLMLTMHHIISDGWSLQVFFDDLVDCYQSLQSGNPPRLPALKYQYSDYTRWQNKWQESEDFDAKCEFWLDKLQGVRAGLELPVDKPRPEIQSFRGSRHVVELSQELSEQLKTFSKQQGVSLYMVLLTAYEILLFRRSRQEDIVIGTVTANRDRAELSNLVGFFVNVFVLRTTLDGNASCLDTLEAIKSTTLEAYDYMDVPFEVLVEKLHPTRDLSRAPVFQIAFDLRDSFLTKSPMPGVELVLMEPELEISKYDLHLTLEEREEGLKAIWEYATDLFEYETIVELANQYETLLRSFLANPLRAISTVSLIPEHELQHHIEACRGQTREEYLEDESVVSLVERQAERFPDKTAVDLSGMAFTYRELDERSNKLARYLRDQGVRQGNLVAISLDRSLEMVVAILGVMKSGAAYVPIDPAYPHDRIAFILQQIEPPLLLTQAKLAENFSSFDIKSLELDSGWAEVNDFPGASPGVTLLPQDLAYAIFTSGSTGQPKGVLLEHRGLVNLTHSQIEAFKISSESRVLQFASFGFDASVSEIFTALAAGATLCLGSKEELLPGTDLVNFINRNRISVVTLPPSVLRVLPESELPTLRTLVSAGEACSSELVSKWATNRTFINAYGPTETTVCATLGEVEPDPLGRMPDIGYPLANFAVYILDESLHPVPSGVVGELCVAGVGIARGYLGPQELTAEKFVHNPNDTGTYSRLYKTGDLGVRKKDGRIEYIGRKDNQIKLRGFRIELGEIEHILRNSPDVHDAVVMLREDRPGDKKLVSYIVSEGVGKEFGRRGGSEPDVSNKLELWPSIAEFFVYDELIYYAMTHDEIRNDSYKVAINKLVRDKVVLDIGTGRDAILSRFCVEAGARKVYAIELLEESYQGAKSTIEELGLQDKIELIYGDATQVQLPEKIDVCVSEIVGAIGGSEGAAAIINDAWRFMKESGRMIPSRSTTLIAGVNLPQDFLATPRFSELTGHYVKQIFEQVGYKFDLRLSVRNLSRDYLISSEDVFEDLDYNQQIELESRHNINLKISKDGVIDGFLVWLTLETIEGESFDILDNEFCWLPVFLPVFEPPVEVRRSDRIKATVVRTVCENGLNPDFNIRGVLERTGQKDVEFNFTSYHNRKEFRSTRFYQRLFENDSINIEVAEDPHVLQSRIRGFLAKRLPDYMQPNVIVTLDSLPLNPSGKIDRDKLPAPDASAVDQLTEARVPASRMEQEISSIWKRVLTLEVVEADQNFFDIGGDSLKMAEVQNGLLELTGRNIGLVELFQYPTISALASHLETDPNADQSEGTQADVARQRSGSGRQRMLDLAKRQQAIRKRPGQ